RQHPQRRACAPFRRPHRRHVEGRDRVRRSAPGAGGRAPLGDLWRRRVAGVSVTKIVIPRKRVAFPPNWPVRMTLLALALYVIYASTILDITWARFVVGLDQGARFISRMWPPDIASDKLELLTSGMIASLQIAIIATVVGV